MTMLQAAFARALRRQMKAKRVRHVDLARALGITRPGVSHMLSGRVNLTCSTMERAAAAVGCHIDLVMNNNTWLPKVIGAPQWLKDRMAAQRKRPPPTVEEVRIAWAASANQRDDFQRELDEKIKKGIPIR